MKDSDIVPVIRPARYGYAEKLAKLPTANQAPCITGTIRKSHADFEVTEILSFEPSGEGEHLFLYIEKNRCNTSWIAEQLQKHFQLRSQDIGYAGKKDKYSIAKQWFSLHIPGKSVSIDELDNDNFRVLKAIRHNKKLRKGVIKQNHFKIRVTDLAAPLDSKVVDFVSKNGFPNYFGYQRFGYNANNLVQVSKLFNQEIKVRSRNKKGLYFSAARSYLFNLMLAKRLDEGVWDRLIPGDCVGLSGSQSYFVCETIDDELKQRLIDADIHISGWLVGQQDSQAEQQAHQLESEVIEEYSDWLSGLSSARIDSSRRPMRVMPEALSLSELIDNEQIIEFSLPSGSFATSLLRELIVINDAAVNNVK